MIFFKKTIKQNTSAENEVNGTEFLYQKQGFSQPTVFIFSMVGVSKKTGKSAFLDSLKLLVFSTPNSELRNQFSQVHFLSNPVTAVKMISLLLFVPKPDRQRRFLKQRCNSSSCVSQARGIALV